MGPCAFPLHWTREMAHPSLTLVDNCTELLLGLLFKGTLLFGNLLAATSPHRAQEAKGMVSKARLLVRRCAACPGRRMTPET